jgi:5'-nucleotidase / UDP-sugar diphosphatase
MNPSLAQITALTQKLIVSMGLSLGMGGIPAVLAEPIDITLLHLNDIYEITPVAGGKSGGLARVATVRRQLIQANPNTLTVLAGDAFSPSALGTAQVKGDRLAGQQMVAVLNTLGLNYATFGNHEFDISASQFRQRLRESKFQWISSNVVDANGFPFWGVPVSQILNMTGKAGTKIQVGILGVTIASNPRDYVQYQDAIAAAQLQVKNLQRQGADIIIALTHLSLAEDQQLAANVPEIDLILGGHEHENIQQWRLVSRPHLPKGCLNVGIPIFKADANVRTVYIHNLRYDTATQCLTIASELRPITPTIPDDPKTAAEVQSWLQKGFAAFRAQGFEPLEVVTTLTENLDGLESSVRNLSTNLTQLIATAMLQSVDGAELAIFNGGSIRIDDVLPAGVITQYDVIRILPFGGKILQVKMKGAVLQRVLEQGMANRGSGGYLQTANVTQVQPGKWQIQGKPIDLDRVYRIAISDFLMSGREQGLGFLTLTTPGIEPVGESGDIRFAVIKQLRAMGNAQASTKHTGARH